MREKLFNVTIKDCKVDVFRSGGKGGQHQNKTSSGVRITHFDSGAIGKSTDTRSQHQNKRIAFKRMSETKAFKSWCKIEASRVIELMGDLKGVNHGNYGEFKETIQVKEGAKSLN